MPCARLRLALLLAVLLPAVVAQPVAAVGPPLFDRSPDGRFGGIQVSDLGAQGLANASDLGIGWTRELYLWVQLADGLDVKRIPVTTTDQHLPQGSIEIVGLLQWTPPYANGGQDKTVPPNGLTLPWNHPANAWGQYAYAVAKARAGRVNRWLIWNEPDICQPGMAGHNWAGSVQDYYNLLKVAYQAIKAGNPNAVVIFGSIGIVDSLCQSDKTETSFFNQWLQIAAADPATPANNWWFDELSLNIHKEPEKIYDLLLRYHALMQRYGFDKSTWLMEVGIPVVAAVNFANNADLAVTKDDQESFLVQAYANAIAGGADHIGIFRMSDFPRSDAAYATLKTVVKYFSHVTSARKDPENSTLSGTRYVNRYSGVVKIFMEGPGFRQVVLYNRGFAPQSVTVPASSDQAIVVDKHGVETPLPATNGGYTLTLDPVAMVYDAPWGERVRFIGGSPLILRERV